MTKTGAAFGRELRKLRHNAGLSQEALAFAAGLHRTYISQLERGLKSPSLDTLFLVSKALGVTPSELIQPYEARLLAHSPRRKESQ